jgi:hypothetical protein
VNAPAYALIASFVVAGVGLWWFHFIMKGLPNVSRRVRYGVYAAVWLAYFFAVLIVIAQAQP